METKNKSRQNINGVKKKVASDARQARYLANVVNADDKILERIDVLERKITSASLNRKNPKHFCTKEIEELQLILFNLKKRALKRASRAERVFCFIVLVVNFMVFGGYYSSSIPNNMYQTNPNFYFVLGTMLWLLLMYIFFLYFRAYKRLMVTVLFPLLSRIKSSDKKADAFFKGSTELFLGSLCTGGYRVLVLVFATTIPANLSPSLPIFDLLTNLWNNFINVFVSNAIVAICSLITLIPTLMFLFKKVSSTIQNKETP